MTAAFKKLWSSFRVRLLVGTFAWTAGLLFIAHMVSVIFLFGYDSFRRIAPSFGIVALVLGVMIAGVLIVRSGIARFTELRRRLNDVHEGRERVVLGTFATEVQPLVDDLNALLRHRDKRVSDALAKAGDLAHGLKTPLAVLGQEAERAAAEGHHELASLLSQQVERMRRQIDYHLAHARAAASGATVGARCLVATSAQGIARTLERLHTRRGLLIDINVPEDHAVRTQREDLDEMLGNLLDNACKWARTRVALASSRGDNRVSITVDDDGPGLPASMRDAVLQRGVRADEAAPGTGLGLSIVRDLAELYGGSVMLDTSPLGGLRARLQLPDADSVQAPFSSTPP